MEVGSVSGSGGGPAPFLVKTYEMLEDSSTDNIVSWSSSNNSFIVWNPAEFGRYLLPSYFKHNNFSSFIRQLNTYGFRKIHPERWEFANDDFVKDQKRLLKNIHRRKPIHSHSHPPGSLANPERSAFEEEIEELSQEKTTIESNISSYKQLHSTAKLHLEDLQQRLDGMETRQKNLLIFFEKALQNPTLVEQISGKFESMDLSVYNKKRRLPQVDYHLGPLESSFVDNQSGFRTEFGNVFHQDFSNKLRLLKMSPVVSDMNSASNSTENSNEEESSYMMLSEVEPKEIMQARTTTLAFEPATLERADTGASLTFNMDSCLSEQREIERAEEGDNHISCHLNLSLASSSEVNRFRGNDKESDGGASSNTNMVNEATNLALSQVAPIRVNDMFWEQFLTETPGHSDDKDVKANQCDEQDEGRSVHGISRYVKNMDRLTL